MRDLTRSSSTRRLGHLARRPTMRGRIRDQAGSLLDWPTPEGWLLTRRARAVRRGLTILLWTLPCMPVQALCLIMPGRPKVAFARLYWAVFSRLLGVRVRVVGSLASGEAGQPGQQPAEVGGEGAQRCSPVAGLVESGDGQLLDQGVGDQVEQLVAAGDPAVEGLVGGTQVLSDGGHGQAVEAELEGGGDDLLAADPGRAPASAPLLLSGHAVILPAN